MDGELLTLVCVAANVDRSRVNAAQLTDLEWALIVAAASRLSHYMPDGCALLDVITGIAYRTQRAFTWTVA